MNERTYNLPGKLNADELEQVRAAARKVNLSPAAYVRRRLKLKAEVKPGAPLGNRNAKKGGKA